MQEPQFVQYTDLKDMPKIEHEEKSAEQIKLEADEHANFMLNYGTIARDRFKAQEEEAQETVQPVKKQPSSDLGVQGAYLHDMAHDEDPKELLLKKIGDLSSLRLSGAQVLVATYIRPERKKSGIILTNSVREEDKFQGKCGLVLKLGPLAYKATEKLDFGGYSVAPGTWVWYRPMDGYALSVNGVHCRVLDDVEIKGDIDHPDVVI